MLDRMTTRIGFLYNHYTPHQVFHSAPVAFALSSRFPALEVEIIASCRGQLGVAQRIGAGWPGHRVRFRLARLPLLASAVRALRLDAWCGSKRSVLRANRDYFASLDALVVPERTSAALRSLPGLDHLQLIQIPHGAGDRAVGYEARNADFDLVLVAGEKCRRRLLDDVGLPEHRVHVIGYPKLETVSGRPRPRLFENDRPTVLYNPHFEVGLSSWPAWGTRVLDWFAAQSAFNLIFAPHVMMYQRPLRHRAASLRRYRGLPHMLMDTGSERSMDMTYTRAADIYLGDVSSQVYEFVEQPRPAVFLNAHGVAGWRRDPNYRHWQLGSVINSLDDLPGALLEPFTPAHVARQQEMVAHTFDQSGDLPSLRGAGAIVDLLGSRTARRPSSAIPATPVLAGA